MSQIGQNAKYSERADNFRFAPINGHHQARKPCRKSAKLRHTNTYSIPSSARASTVGGMVRKRLPGLPTTVILFEPSVGLPTQLRTLIHVEKASMTGACGLWGIETR